MNIEKFIADRISGEGLHKSNISKPIVKIGIIGIATGMAVMLLTVSIVLGFKKEISSKITGLSAEVVVKSAGTSSGNEPNPLLIEDSVLTAIKNLPYVKRVQKVGFKNGIIKTKTENEGIVLKGVDGDFDFSFLEKNLQTGVIPDYGGQEVSNAVFISRSLADKLALDTGAKLLVYFIVQKTTYDSLLDQEYTAFEKRARTFKICGIFKTDFSDFDESLAIIDLRQIQKLNYWSRGEGSAYEIKTTGLENAEQQVETIQEICGYSCSVEGIRDIYYTIFIWLDKLDINGVIIVILMILVATVNMVTALLILILERSNMVGLLKTLGMPNLRVRNLFLWISLRLTGKGLFYGNLAGIGLCLIQYYFKWVKLNPETYYVEHVAIELNWLYFLYLNLGTLVVCLLVLLLPTLVLSRLTPLKTLRLD
ncbi:MAG: ABC transporter permease [Bacteroidia bacterium]|nr:ABC transporter permease [Bacteroidia bacterium]